MAKRTTGQTCPLCDQAVNGEGLDALGRHFRVCPKTDRAHVKPDGSEE